MVDLEQLKNLCRKGRIQWTNHILVRLMERGITLTDVENAIVTGTIIEQYPDDYPHPSCLVLGLSVNHKYLHVVCGIAVNQIYMITAYYPNLNKWEKNFTRRREL